MERNDIREMLFITQKAWASLLGVSRAMVSLEEMSLRTFSSKGLRIVASLNMKWAEAAKTFDPDAGPNPEESGAILDFLKDRLGKIGLIRKIGILSMENSAQACLPAKEALHFYQLNPDLLKEHPQHRIFEEGKGRAKDSLEKNGSVASLQAELNLALLNFEENWIREKLQSLE